MANLKNICKLAGLLCVIVCLCLGLVACGGGEDTTASTQETTVGTSTYTIRVRTVSGVSLKDVSVYVYTDATQGELETMKKLDAEGCITFEATTSDQYVAVLMGVPQGYGVQEYYALNPGETEIVLSPAVITDEEKPADKVYALGDVMYDFTITDCNGQTHTLSQLLEEKDAVVLNFWYLNCTPCKLEFPYLEMAYADYSDRIEVLAINCEDGNDAQLQSFASEYELTFPLAIGDKSYWCPAAYNACPTTIVIDRYGTIVYMHTGYFDEAAPFYAMFRMVTAEDYTQTFIENIEDYIIEEDYRPDGSAERPYELGGALEFDVKVPANGLVYYNLYRLMDVTMRIENPNAYVIVEGETHYPVNGVIELQVSCEDTMKPLNVAFGNTGSTKNTVHVAFVFEPGNVNNPISLEIGENEVVVNNVNELGVYYTFTAPASGTLTITVQECPELAFATIQMYNENTYEQVIDGVVDPDTGLTSYSITVNEGDRLQIIIGAGTVDSEMVLESVTIQALASLVEDGGNGVLDGKEAYSISVVDQNGEPVFGAKISLSAGGQNATLTTDATGMVSIRLTENAYLLELTVPSGYIADVTSFLWSPAMKELHIQVCTAVSYSVTVQTEDGAPVSNALVQVYADELLEDVLYAINTDGSGQVTFAGKADTAYYLTIGNVDAELEVQDLYVTGGENTVITLYAQGTAPGYQLGAVADDFAVTDLEGKHYSLSQLLREKSVVVITFWEGGAVSSANNLANLQKIYDIYKDQVAILALNPVDQLDAELLMYKEMYNLTYPLAKCDPTLAMAMGVKSFPMTMIIDREGRVCLAHSGEISEADYATAMEFYLAPDYVHTPFKSLDALLSYVNQQPVTPEDPEDEEN